MPFVIIAIQPLIKHCSEDFMTVDGVNHRNNSGLLPLSEKK